MFASCSAATDTCAHAGSIEGEIVDLGAECQCNARLDRDCLKQHLLQVGAMDHPIGRAVPRQHGGTERQRRDFAAGMP